MVLRFELADRADESSKLVHVQLNWVLVFGASTMNLARLGPLKQVDDVVTADPSPHEDRWMTAQLPRFDFETSKRLGASLSQLRAAARENAIDTESGEDGPSLP